MNIDKLMTKYINGDRSAFEQVYAQTRNSVYYVALSVLHDRASAEDAMQSTYLSVLRNADKYTPGTNAAAWIVKIAKNEALNIRKARSRETSVDETEDETAFGVTEVDEYGLLVDLAKKLLPEDEFAILMLVVSGGYKRREIADMLEMPVPTVTWKYNNALGKMRGALDNKKGGA
ncbi:MAG: RNA polymerase sigma factor [Clostridiales bacterium]|nr:RNA polymerase sigma factor [Clostridiales bacterium]